MSAGVVTFYCYGATHMILMAFALDKTRKRRTLAGFVLAVSPHASAARPSCGLTKSLLPGAVLRPCQPIVAFLFAMENFSIGGMVKAEDAGETDPTLSSLRYLVHCEICGSARSDLSTIAHLADHAAPTLQLSSIRWCS